MPNRRRANTGPIGTLDRTSSASPRAAVPSTSRAVECAEHHLARWSDRFDPLCHPDLLADGGVAPSARADLTRYDLTRVQAHA